MVKINYDENLRKFNQTNEEYQNQNLDYDLNQQYLNQINADNIVLKEANIERLNYLYNKSKEKNSLTYEEQEEQGLLRSLLINYFKTVINEENSNN